MKVERQKTLLNLQVCSVDIPCMLRTHLGHVYAMPESIFITACTLRATPNADGCNLHVYTQQIRAFLTLINMGPVSRDASGL